MPRVSRGFTLLEILVVISIIAILAGMVIPTYYYAKERARETKDRVTVKALELAFKSYLDTYKVWPTAWPDAPIPINGSIFTTLRGDYDATLNPQSIVFYEFESYTNYPDPTTAYDSWSDPIYSTPQPYQVMFDKSYANKITLPNEIVYRSVIVWSVGKNRTNEYGGGDDVASWR